MAKSTALSLEQLNTLLYRPFKEFAERHGLRLSTVSDECLYRRDTETGTYLDVRLADVLIRTEPNSSLGYGSGTIEFTEEFWENLTPGDWAMRLELIDILFETKAKQLRGAVIIHQLSKPWALSYVDDDSLQVLENAAIKIMEFIDTRRKKFEV